MYTVHVIETSRNYLSAYQMKSSVRTTQGSKLTVWKLYAQLTLRSIEQYFMLTDLQG